MGNTTFASRRRWRLPLFVIASGCLMAIVTVWLNIIDADALANDFTSRLACIPVSFGGSSRQNGLWDGAQSQLEPQRTSAPARCGMCDVAPELCVELGWKKMNRAVAFEGSNARLRRVLRKMKAGEPWVMGVIGGSGMSSLSSVDAWTGLDWGQHLEIAHD